MARPRKPTKLLEMKGAFKANPQRRRERENEPVPDTTIGKPPKCLNSAQRKTWQEIVDSTPDGVITRMDRAALEVLAILLHRFRTSEQVKGAELSALMRCLTAFGMTPADRSRVHAPSIQPVDDEWADF